MPQPRPISQVGTNTKPVATNEILLSEATKAEAIAEVRRIYEDLGHSYDPTSVKVKRWRNWRGRFTRRGWYVTHKVVWYGQHYGRPLEISIVSDTHTAYPDIDFGDLTAAFNVTTGAFQELRVNLNGFYRTFYAVSDS